MNEDRKHHPYSPSTLQSLEACPCYQNKQEAVLHERCIAGTRAHKVTETGVDDARLSDEDALAAADCMDFYEHRKQVLEEARKRDVDALAVTLWGKPVPLGEPLEVHEWAESRTPKLVELKETYLMVDDDYFVDTYSGLRTEVRATTAGYVDRAIINHTRTYAEITDYKFGLWPVEDAENNLQGISYSLGLFRAYPTVKKIRFFFKQPHLGLISTTIFTREQIPTLYLRIQTVVARARLARHAGDFSMAKPSVPVCNFCKHIGRCPKVAEIALKVGQKFYALEIPEDITPSMIHDAKNAAMGKRLAQVVAVWAKAYSQELADRVLRGEAPVPEGYRLETRATRTIVDKEKFKQVALRYLTEAEYLQMLEPSFTPIESLINERAPRGQKRLAVDQYQKELVDAGAVKYETPYTFLKSQTTKEETKQQQ